GGQFMFTGGISTVPSLLSSASTVAAIAFGVAAYALMFSAMQTLNAEGKALWLLYSFPHSIESVLKEKARLWGVLALVYPAAILAIGVYYTQDPPAHVAGYALMALLGVPIFSVIAVALGVFASDPLAVEVSKRLRPAYVYLYFMLSSMYIYAIAAVAWWQSA